MDGFVKILYCLLLMFNIKLFVLAQQRPRIIEHPADVAAAREEPLTLNCKAAGRPTPEVVWYHNGIPLVPSERRVVLPEGSLFFLRVMQNKREQDAGIYWCEAKSTAGVAVSRNATLQIAMLRDDFRLVPRDTVALVGGHVMLNCTPPRGIPEPSVLWYLNGKLLDLSGKRLSMVEQGSILISEVQLADAGKYECSAQSMAGIKSAPPAILKVLAPPTILSRPQDSEVIEGEGLDLPCELTGDPKPNVTWHRENGNLPEGRFRILLDNTLRIEDARPEDQGNYICKGHNEGGNVSLPIKLFVYATPSFIEAPVDVEVKLGESLSLPCKTQGRPKTRIIWEKIDFDVIIPTESSENDSQEKFMSKTKILSFRSKRDENKSKNITTATTNAVVNRTNFDNNSLRQTSKLIHRRSVNDNVNDNSEDDEDDSGDNSSSNDDVNDNNLLASTTPFVENQPKLKVNANGDMIIEAVTQKNEGWYACAGVNEAGSIVKRVFVHVLGSEEIENSFKPFESSNSRFNSGQNLIITSVTPTSAYSLKVTWDISDKTIQLPSTKLTLNYRPITENEFKIDSSIVSTKEYELKDLKPYMEYEVFLSIPMGLGGFISNIRKGKTLDGPPTAPPSDVRVGVINNTAAYVRWSPPPLNMLNGELTGYKIQIKSNITNKLLGQMSLNASTQSVVINSLSPGGRYIARVAPLTSGGLGPYSPPAPLHMDPSFIVRPPKTDPATIGWTTSWMSGIALGILGICLVGGAIFAVIWAKRDKRIMKASYPGPILTSTLPDKQHSLWLQNNTLVKPMHMKSSIPPPPPPHLPAEYAEVRPTIMQSLNSQLGPPEPYATVTLQRNGMGGIGISTQSDDSCIKCSVSPSSSEYNAPVIRETLNLCDVLPPPPDHPYSSYKPPNNMTIRTNPQAMSPQVMRKVSSSTPLRWGTMPPPIPTFPQNWSPDRQMMPRDVETNQECYSENDYECGSVLYEQCFSQIDENGFFGHGGEPTEEYYRHINMEFLDDQDFEPSTPPPPCPDAYQRMNANLRLLGNMGGGTDTTQSSSSQISPINVRRPLRNGGGGGGGSSGSGGGCGTQSVHSSDSESDNRWAPTTSSSSGSAATAAATRQRRSRSRSKSSDRKYHRPPGGGGSMNQIIR